MPINLNALDVTFLVDFSSSMEEKQKRNGTISRWDYLKESIKAFLAKFEPYDDNGVDFAIFNNRVKASGTQIKPDNFDAYWDGLGRPGGGTELADALDWAFKLSLPRRKEKVQLIIVATDGEPNPGTKQTVINNIVRAANEVKSNTELKVVFLRVGYDQVAADFLNQLDNDLKREGAKNDIICTMELDDAVDMLNQGIQGFVDHAMAA